MDFRPSGNNRLWDTWFFDNGGEYHLFYLCNPGSKPGENWLPWDSIGHAVSRNLLDWEEREKVTIKSNRVDDWDYVVLLTGNIFKFGNRYGMTYGAEHEDHIQKIGLLISEDLEHWSKYEGNPVLIPQFPYEATLEDSASTSISFRDASIKPMNDGSYEALFCARLNKGAHAGRGVIGRAVSEDGIHWTMVEPVFNPGCLNAPEVPDTFTYGGKSYLTFCTNKHIESDFPCGAEYPGIEWATFYAVKGEGEDSYAFSGRNILAPGDSYVGRIVSAGGKNLFFHHLVSQMPAFALPKEVVFQENGSIRLVKWDGIKALETGKEITDFSALVLDDKKGFIDGSLELDGSECTLDAGDGQCVGFFRQEYDNFSLKVDMEWEQAGRVGIVLREDKDGGQGIVMAIDRPRGELYIGNAQKKVFQQTGVEKKHRYRPEKRCFEKFTIELVARSEGVDWFLNGYHFFTTVHDDAPISGRVGFLAEVGAAKLSNLRLVSLKKEESFT